MSKLKFTTNQQNCIDVVGGNILVSAAAGSGKTAVLTQRVIELLTGENPISADRLVIVTFTVLAADEMRQRISAKLSELIEQQPTNKTLQNQQLLLANAKISTIHSLCSSLIRENFQKLGIANDFKIADETQIELVKTDAVKEVLEKHYEAENQEFYQMFEFIGSKDDRKLINLILTTYDYIRSFAFPKTFLKKCISTYENTKDLQTSIWYENVKEHIIDALENCISKITNAIEQIKLDADVLEKYNPAFENDLTQLKDIATTLKQNEWEKAVIKAFNIEKLSLKPVRNYEDKEFLKQLQDTRATVYKTIEDIKKRYLYTNEIFLEDIKVLTPKIKFLFELVNDVYDLIEQRKNEQDLIDYADLEHFAIKLLATETENGYEKTEIAVELSEYFEQIMIDECQDINEVQNLIFKLLSRNEQNLFMVGDVKQSIYRFRKAMPDIFVQKKNTFKPYNKETHSNSSESVILLENNFRSREQVCETVNYIFKQIMSEKIGEINYDKSESLVPSAKYQPYENATPEIHIIDYDKNDEDAKTIVEARHIGTTIKNMINQGYMVQGKDQLRKCTYRDFAILLRSKKDKATVYAQQLKEMGVPCFSDSTEGYFNEYEIATTLSLLRIIDNPLLDVCLVSVLMSPMFGFSADLIAQIRIRNKNTPFFVVLNEHAQSGNKQCQDFIKTLTALRQKSATLKTDEIIQEIYDLTDITSLSYALGNGEQKDANLRLLLIYAKQYDGIGTGGLAGFLRYIDRVIANKQDFSCANTVSQKANTVKIISIHSSKGLEFPICIIADCAKNFNTMDLKKSAQLNSKLGFAMKITDYKNLKSYSNLPFESVKLKSKKESISEEMRVLYVALTRAKEKLIMVATFEKAREKIATFSSANIANGKISTYDIFNAKSYAQWIISAAIRNKGLENIRRECDINIPVLQGDVDLKAEIFSPTQQQIAQPEINELKEKPDEEIIKSLHQSFAYEYPNMQLTQIPTKLTVTQIAKQQNSKENTLQASPSFMYNKSISPAMRGTILHSFMQFADYNKANSNLQDEIDRLVEQEFISKQHAQALNKNKIKAFFKSEIYKRMQTAKSVKREYKFLHFLNASEVTKDLPQEYAKEQVLIQGIADCLIFENDEITIVDYKTDYEDNPQVLIDRYYNQLRIYKLAIEKAFNKKVKQCLIYSLHQEKQIEILIK